MANGLDKMRRYTGKYGKTQTGRFLQDYMCTILITIQAITGWTTWRRLPANSAKRNAINADTSPDPQRSMQKYARSAGEGSQQQLRGKAYVPTLASLSENEQPYVVGVRKLAERQPVYAVKVKSNPVFYANGILVHNCDCVQMCLARYRTGGFIRLPSDYQDEDEDTFKARQKAYYG
jgi:hypothetical protein